MSNQVFRTESLDLAAYLVTAGFEPDIIRAHDLRRAIFAFTETEELTPGNRQLRRGSIPSGKTASQCQEQALPGGIPGRERRCRLMTGTEQFVGTIRKNLGYAPDPGKILPGKIIRFATSDRKGDNAGWCKLFDDGKVGSSAAGGRELPKPGRPA